jgi:hypothetical protein
MLGVPPELARLYDMRLGTGNRGQTPDFFHAYVRRWVASTLWRDGLSCGIFFTEAAG